MRISNLICFIFSIWCFSLSSYAQIDAMRPKGVDEDIEFNIPSANTSTDKTFEFINPKNEEKRFEKALNEMMLRQIKDKEEEDLQNKGIIDKEAFYRKRLQSEMDAITNKLPIIDQDLGGFSTQSKFITIVCRDFAYPDGDIVSIILNNEEVIRNLELTQSFQRFTIPLQVGLNNLAFKAINQGSSGPNTAAFMVFDQNGNLLSSNSWNLATGAKAYLSIARDN